LLDAGLSTEDLATRRFAIVAPGAAFESKRWEAGRFAAVIDLMLSRWQLESIVVAGPGQEKLVNEVAAFAESRPAVLSKLSLSELKALIEVFGRVFVGNDSGPMHIAAAVGCPIVAVFGSSNPDVWHPWSEAPYRVLGGERGRPDNNHRDKIDRVEVDEVASAIGEVLQAAQTVHS